MMSQENECNSCAQGIIKPEEFRPINMRYSLDAIADSIAQIALQQRLSGIKIELRQQRNLTLLKEVSGGQPGKRWRIRYGRQTYTNDRFNLMTGADCINIPELELHLSDDGSSLCLYRYIGKDWPREEDAFMEDKTESAFKNRPRMGVFYSIYSKALDWLMLNRNAVLYKPDDKSFLGSSDCEREYAPNGTAGEPRYLNQKEIFNNIETFLRQVLFELTNDHKPMVKPGGLVR